MIAKLPWKKHCSGADSEEPSTTTISMRIFRWSVILTGLRILASAGS